MGLVFIGLGSNLGDGRKNLQHAWHAIGHRTDIGLLALSSPYHSAPIGVESEQWFTNAVGLIETTLQPDILLAILLQVEAEMGRDRSKGSDRAIDLDILYFDDLVLNSPDLVVPHPEIFRRLFVLAPLAELAPDLVHPVNSQTTLAMKKFLDLAEPQFIKQISWRV